MLRGALHATAAPSGSLRAGFAFRRCLRGVFAFALLAPAAARAPPLARCLVLAKHCLALLRAGILEARPPIGQLGCRLAGFCAYEQEIVRGTKARMLEQAKRPRACALVEARLQRP